MEQKAQIALASKRQELLASQLMAIDGLEELDGKHSAYIFTKEETIKRLKAKISSFKFMNNSVRDEDLINFLKYKWLRVRKTLLRQWVEQEFMKQMLHNEALPTNKVKENYNDLLMALGIGMGNEYEFENIRDYQYILIPKFFKAIGEVTLSLEENEYLDPINTERKKQREAALLKVVPENLFINDINLSKTQKANIKELLSKQERRQDTIAFIIKEIIPYQSTDSVIADEDMLEKLFNAEFIPYKQKV